MRVPYSYSVLRYVHDAVSGEFVNVGVVLYAPGIPFLSARCTNHYSRAARLFDGIDGENFRRTVKFLEAEINKLGEQIKGSLSLLERNLDSVLLKILPRDDSALQFASPGAGVSTDLGATLDDLFDRLVSKYEQARRVHRTEEDVWKTFRAPLTERNVIQFLHPKKISSPDLQYEFQHAWKNGRWHALEPISFDFADGQYVEEKAIKWLGRMSGLKDSDEDLTLHVLLGEPSEPRLAAAYARAQNLLHRMPAQHEFHREQEADELASWLASEIKSHESSDE